MFYIVTNIRVSTCQLISLSRYANTVSSCTRATSHPATSLYARVNKITCNPGPYVLRCKQWSKIPLSSHVKYVNMPTSYMSNRACKSRVSPCKHVTCLTVHTSHVLTVPKKLLRSLCKQGHIAQHANICKYHRAIKYIQAVVYKVY